MGLNKVSGNMYGWVTHTWNAQKGKCYFDCYYCYMKKWGEQPEPRFDEKELKADLGEDNVIFAGSSCDMWAPNVSDDNISRILEHCRKFNNKYVFQSKSPGRFLQFTDEFPERTILGTTIETNNYYPGIMGRAPTPIKRMVDMISVGKEFATFVTIEPIMKFGLIPFVEMIEMIKPAWVNVGADSQNREIPEPSALEIEALLDALSKITVVEKKNNLKRLFPGKP